MKETKMSRTTFSGPVKSGTIKYNTYQNTGTTVLEQRATITPNLSGLVTTVTEYIPANSVLLNIVIDVVTGFDSATSAGLTIGNSITSNLYVTTTSVLAAAQGRITPTFTAAQLSAMNNTAADISSAVTGESACSALVLTVTSVGQPTAGNIYVTFTYAQSDDRSAATAQ